MSLYEFKLTIYQESDSLEEAIDLVRSYLSRGVDEFMLDDNLEVTSVEEHSNMHKYEVEIAGARYVTARVVVEANSHEEAEQKVLDMAGDLDWDCDRGTEDLEVQSIIQLN